MSQEVTLKLKLHEAYHAARENDVILNAYQRACTDAFQGWYEDGCCGSVMPRIESLMRQRGVI